MAAYESNASPPAGSSNANGLQSLASRRKNKPRSFECLFPSKLYKMLEEVDSLGLSGAVSWQPHGRAFIIKDKDLFLNEVVPKFFKATKIRSFQRQCHLWGYKRIPSGHDAGAWWHESFVRGRPEILKHIVRTQVKGMASHVHVPDFYQNKISSKTAHYMGISMTEMERSPETISLSSKSKSDDDKEFEHLDEELEALFKNTSSTSSTSPRNLPKDDDSGEDYMCDIGNFNCSSTDWNISISTSSSDNTDQKANSNHDASPYCKSAFVHTSQQNDTMGNGYKPDYVPVSYGRNGASAHEYVGTDEFSAFIEKMIQLP